jgi:rubrerythrin
MDGVLMRSSQQTIEQPMKEWPDLTEAKLGDVLYYCRKCTYQNNTTQEGTAPSRCPSHRTDVSIWKVEQGDKERQVEWFKTV